MPGGLVVESELPEDFPFSAPCLPPSALCDPGDVPTSDGTCRAVEAPCPLGGLGPGGACSYVPPKCARHESAVAGSCVSLGASWSCPTDQNYPTPRRSATRYVQAGAQSEGADGSVEHPFPEIQRGVDAADPGDEILVGPGTYSPFVVGMSGIAVRGACPDRVHVKSESAGVPSVLVRPPGTPGLQDVRIEGLRLSGAGPGLDAAGVDGLVVAAVDATGSTSPGVRIDDSSRVHVRDLRILGVAPAAEQRNALLVASSSTVVVERVEVVGADVDLFRAIHLLNVDGALIDGALISNTLGGIQIDHGSGLTQIRSSKVQGFTSNGVLVGPPQSTSEPIVRLEEVELAGGVESGPPGSAAGLVGIAPFAQIEVHGSYIHGCPFWGVDMQAGTLLQIEASRLESNGISDVRVYISEPPIPSVLVDSSAFVSRGFGVFVGGPSAGPVSIVRCRFEAAASSLRRELPLEPFAGIYIDSAPSAFVAGCSFSKGLTGDSITLRRVDLASVRDSDLHSGPRGRGVTYLGDSSAGAPAGELRIERNHFRSALGSAIVVAGPGSSLIDSNLITTTQRPSEGWAGASISFEPTGGERAELLVVNNSILGGAVGGVGIFGGVAELRNNAIAGVAGRGVVARDAQLLLADNFVASIAVTPLVTNAGTTQDTSVGGELAFMQSATITGNRFSASNRGLSIGDQVGGDLLIAHNTFTAHLEVATHLQQVDASTRSLLKENKITCNGDFGVLLHNSTAALESNTINDNEGAGVSLAASGADLVGNAVTGNRGLGVSVVDSTATMLNNEIRGTRLDSLKVFGDNIAIAGTSTVSLNGDRLSGAATAGLSVEAAGSVELEIARATITDNGRVGVDLHLGAKARIGQGTRISGNAHSGVVARGAVLEIEGAVIEGAVPWGPNDSYGDGIQAVLGATVACSNSTIRANKRAGVLLDDSVASFDSCTVGDNVYGIVLQHGGDYTWDGPPISDNEAEDVSPREGEDTLAADVEP